MFEASSACASVCKLVASTSVVSPSVYTAGDVIGQCTPSEPPQLQKFITAVHAMAVGHCQWHGVTAIENVPLFTSGDPGLGLVILVLVLRIWSCLHHCQASELVGLAAPSQESHPALGLRPRFLALLASLGSLCQQFSFPQCIRVLIKTLVMPIFLAK